MKTRIFSRSIGLAAVTRFTSIRLCAVTLGFAVMGQALGIGALSNVHVTSVRVDSDGHGIVTFDQPMGGTPPSCVISAYTNALSFGGTNGKAILALALAAKAQGLTISVYGLGTCSNYGNYVEDWDYGVTN
jgi:hypothetical protein